MRLSALWLPVLFAASVLQAADPALLEMVPPSAKVLAGVNLDQVRGSPLGQFLLAMVPADLNLQQFVLATGFDPRRDLHEILIAASGPEKTAAHLLLARGTFDLPRLLAMAPKEHPLTEQLYHGTRILSSPGPDEMTFAIPDSGMAMAGDLASVKASLDRRGQAMSLDPLLAARAATLSSTLDVWGVSSVPLNTLPATMPSELMAKILQTSGGVKFGDQIQFVLEAATGDPKDAAALGDVLRFLITTVQGQAPPQATAMMQNLHIAAEGTTLRLDVAIPESQIEALITAAKPPTKP